MNENVEYKRIREMINLRDRQRVDALDRERFESFIQNELDNQSVVNESDEMFSQIVTEPSDNTMFAIGDVLNVVDQSDEPLKMYEKLTNFGLSTKNQRVVIDGSRCITPDHGEPYYLIVAEYANDQKTDVKQCGSFLVNNWDKNNEGKAVNIKHGRYSQDQYDKIMNMANCDGDRPVIDADLQVNYDRGHRIISNSVSRPDIAFDAAQHKAMLKQMYASKDYEQKLRADAREIKQFENDIFREL